ncbi:GNAT family N-acetyltransferase [Pseudoruegeria sp. HB172150]|uniref:GNAT family N-acetyltransferase n=1 Tax=Pseudoruegeria sp. HB172150 TaxID=2721164 RepID=UPI0015530D5F|nr:GNAT family N-acetyltransferase [Pseudoruegeria sp. HB172150]
MDFRRPVTREHVRALCRLAVKPEQDGQVAPNAITLAQAAYEPGGLVWGLWDGDVPVGLLAMIDPVQHPEGEEVEYDAAYIWRLMVDADYQGKGFGQRALAEAATVAEDWDRPRLLVSAVEKEFGAIPFYERCGFRRTGRILDGEVEMAVTVAEFRRCIQG